MLFVNRNRLSLLLPLFFILSACGGGGGGGESSSSTSTTPIEITSNSYIGAGSVWDVTTSSDNTFFVKHKSKAGDPVDMEIRGTYSLLDSEFIALTVTSSTGTANNLPAVGSKTYAFHVPGYMFMLKPFDTTNEQMIPMVMAGTCPAPGNTHPTNWVRVKSQGLIPTMPEDDFFGTAGFNASGELEVVNAYALTANFPQVTLPAGLTGQCNNGVIEIPSNVGNSSPAFHMYVTAGGGAIVHIDFSDFPANLNLKDGIIFATPADDLTSASSSAGIYSGFLYDGAKTPGNKVSTVKVVCTTSSTCTGFNVDPITDAVVDDGLFIEISSINTPSTGFLAGKVEDYTASTLTRHGNAKNIVCTIDINAGGGNKKVLSCVGESPSAANMYNVILVER